MLNTLPDMRNAARKAGSNTPATGILTSSLDPYIQGSLQEATNTPRNPFF